MIQFQVFAHHTADENEPPAFLGYVDVPDALLGESGLIDEVADQLGIESRGISFREGAGGSIILRRAGQILYSLEEVLIDST